MAKMTLKKWEGSPADNKIDKKKGLKEGSLKDNKLDKEMVKKINSKGKK